MILSYSSVENVWRNKRGRLKKKNIESTVSHYKVHNFHYDLPRRVQYPSPATTRQHGPGCQCLDPPPATTGLHGRGCQRLGRTSLKSSSRRCWRWRSIFLTATCLPEERSVAIHTMPVLPSPILTKEWRSPRGSPGLTTICSAARNCGTGTVRRCFTDADSNIQPWYMKITLPLSS